MIFSLRNKATGVLDRLYPLVATEGDTERDRMRKSLLLFGGIAGTILTSLSALLAHLSSAPLPVPVSLWLYAGLLATVSIILLATRQGVVPIAVLILAGNIVVSVFGTWYQGGVIPSGANILWGIVAPVVAMLVFGRRAALGWFLVYFAALVGVLVIERASPPVLSDSDIMTNFASVLGGVSIFLFLLFVYFTRERDRAQDEADFERARSDALLRNVLPAEIVTRLKEGERVIADRFDDATVLFADIAGFTPMSATMDPDELVEMLNEIFSIFDHLSQRYGVEKIKTIGDCYMVAAGVPVPRRDHAAVLADMALEMNRIVAERSIRSHRLAFRIGLSSGPLVAGVIGEQKFLYDLWGDTVNTASRMESHGAAGVIQITEATRAHLDGRYRVIPRGTVDVKGKGPLPVYLLQGRIDPADSIPGPHGDSGTE